MAINARDLQKIHDAAKSVHGGLSGFLKLAEDIQNGHQAYREKHWGRDAPKREIRNQPLPNVTHGVIDLGELVSVVYLTEKGGDGELVEYEHYFSDGLPESRRDGTRPMLSFAPDGSGLVIVRGPSEYTVTNRGIEG
jgi:hypothetical protein